MHEQLKNQRAQNYTQQSRTFYNTVTQAKSCLVSPLEQISSLAFNTDLSPNECLLGIREVLTSRQSTIDKCRNTLIELENSFQPVEQDNAYYSALEIKSRKLQNQVAGIIKSAEFTGHKELVNAIRYFQTKDIVENTAPVGFLSYQEHIRRQLTCLL